MTAPLSAAPDRGGFSAIKAVAPLLSAFHEKNGAKLIGWAVERLVWQETGLSTHCPAPRIDKATCERMDEIVAALRALFMGPHHAPHNGAASMGPMMGSPINPLEGKEEKKESLSFPHQEPIGKEKGSFPSPSLEEWAAYAASIGWADETAVRASYRSQNDRLGWGHVRSWKGLCGMFHRNAVAKAEKASRINGAFGGGA